MLFRYRVSDHNSKALRTVGSSFRLFDWVHEEIRTTNICCKRSFQLLSPTLTEPIIRKQYVQTVSPDICDASVLSLTFNNARTLLNLFTVL